MKRKKNNKVMIAYDDSDPKINIIKVFSSKRYLVSLMRMLKHGPNSFKVYLSYVNTLHFLFFMIFIKDSNFIKSIYEIIKVSLVFLSLIIMLSMKIGKKKNGIF